MQEGRNDKALAVAMGTLVNLVIFLSVVIFVLIGLLIYTNTGSSTHKNTGIDKVLQVTENGNKQSGHLPEADKTVYWNAPAETELDGSPLKESILYGKELIVHTASYFGPKGKISMKSTNGMNCQNCHLEAGTRTFGNNYSAVASTYPKYRARSGSSEDMPKRVNDCFERSLNGKALKTNSKEMQAILSYLKWLGTDVAKGEKPPGSGLQKLAYLTRAADPEKGKVVYVEKCASCHQPNGEGLMNADATAYVYPPLWGDHSYNNGAGLYRISSFARFVKYNMPLGVSFHNPQLSDEEAWDVAAYVNSQPRPSKNIRKDWPKIEEKPFDHPFGTYADGFSEKQHKYGPYQPIIDASAKTK